MEDFSKVSLGFAEFVSQLLHETFDAVLGAQNYQLEKYAELEKALSMSNEQFKEAYIGDDEIKENEIELFGISIVENMAISPNLLSLIEGIVKDFDRRTLIERRKLTRNGVKIIEQKVVDTIVAERKAILQRLSNNSEMARLMVDSGEIHAKLELTNLYQSQITDSPQSGRLKKQPAPSPTAGTSSKKTVSQPLQLKVIPVSSVGFKQVKINEITDPISGQKTLIIDKASLQKNEAIPTSIPNVRLIVTPAQTTSTSNLFSEVIIKFKTP